MFSMGASDFTFPKLPGHEKSQVCPIAPKFFLVGYWVTKDPTGNRMSSKWPYLLPFRSYGQKTIVFTRFWRFRLKMMLFWP